MFGFGLDWRLQAALLATTCIFSPGDRRYAEATNEKPQNNQLLMSFGPQMR